MTKEEIGEWLKSVVSGIVSNQDALKVEQSVDDMGVKYTLTVAKEDMGRVIGKQGSVAQAIRTVLRAAGFSSDIRASMIIYDPQRPDYKPRETTATENTDKEMLNE